MPACLGARLARIAVAPSCSSHWPSARLLELSRRPARRARLLPAPALTSTHSARSPLRPPVLPRHAHVIRRLLPQLLCLPVLSSSRRRGVPREPELRPETASGEQEAAGADEQESWKWTEPASGGAGGGRSRQAEGDNLVFLYLNFFKRWKMGPSQSTLAKWWDPPPPLTAAANVRIRAPSQASMSVWQVGPAVRNGVNSGLIQDLRTLQKINQMLVRFCEKT